MNHQGQPMQAQHQQVDMMNPGVPPQYYNNQPQPNQYQPQPQPQQQQHLYDHQHVAMQQQNYHHQPQQQPPPPPQQPQYHNMDQPQQQQPQGQQQQHLVYASKSQVPHEPPPQQIHPPQQPQQPVPPPPQQHMQMQQQQQQHQQPVFQYQGPAHPVVQHRAPVPQQQQHHQYVIRQPGQVQHQIQPGTRILRMMRPANPGAGVRPPNPGGGHPNNVCVMVRNPDGTFSQSQQQIFIRPKHQQQQQPMHVAHSQQQHGHPQWPQQQQQHQVHYRAPRPPPPQQVHLQHHVQVPQQQQQQQQHHQQQQGMNENFFEVEHIFEEDGKIVRKMPIKIGNETMWAEVQNNKETENSLSLPLNAETNLPRSLPQPQQQQQQHHVQPQEQPQLEEQKDDFEPPQQRVVANRKASEISIDERNQAIDRVCKDLVSPQFVAAEVGVAAATIRKWVKDAGQTLPKSYNVKHNQEKKQKPDEAGTSSIIMQKIPANPQQQQPNSPRMPMNQVSTAGPPGFRPMTPGAMNRPPMPLEMPIRHVGAVEREVVLNSGVQNHAPITVVGATPVQVGPAKTVQVQLQPPEDPTSTPSVAATGADASSATAPSSAVQSSASKSEPYVPKRIPGQLVLCKNCGCVGADFNLCERCKKKIPEDCKRIPDSSSKKNLHMDAHGAPDLRTVRIQPKQRTKKKVTDEPVCIALSSDEDEPEDEEKDPQNNGTNGTDDKEKADQNDNGSNSAEKKKSDPDLKLDPISDEMILKGCEEPSQFFSLPCRSIRLGSYKCLPKEKATFTANGVHLQIPCIYQEDRLITINIKKGDVLKVMGHFGRSMPIIFFYLCPSGCTRIRQALGMKDKSVGLWLELDSSDETFKRVTILPEKLNDEMKNMLKLWYDKELQEIDSKLANDLLVRSSPKEAHKLRAKAQQQQQILAKQNSNSAPPPLPLERYCQFPVPSTYESVTVRIEDYLCLEDECFLNDVIIEFYIQWIKNKIMSDLDKQRTHFFSTFFYGRLIKRPDKLKNKLHPIEDNQNLTAAEKRYERVKRWTKKINIFEKDFVVIPINEHSHWFVAVICYPGLIGCRRMDDDTAIEQPESQKFKKVGTNGLPKKSSKAKQNSNNKVLQIGSTSIIPIKNSDGSASSGDPFMLQDVNSDRDEADASDDDMVDEDMFNSSAATTITRVPTTSTTTTTTPSKKEEGVKTENQQEPEEEEDMGELRLEDEEDSNEVDEVKENLEGNEEKKKEKQEEKKPEEELKVQETEEAKKSPKESNEEEAETLKEVQEKIALKQPCILIFDSLRGTGSRARVVATLRDYLQCEWAAKHKGQELREFNTENMKGHCPRVPQQPNFSDCGIFLLQYVESFFTSPIKDFSLPLTSLKHWFPKESVRYKRKNIAEIIRNMTREQNPTKKVEFIELNFAPVTGSGCADDEEEEEQQLANQSLSVAKAIADSNNKMAGTPGSSGRATPVKTDINSVTKTSNKALVKLSHGSPVVANKVATTTAGRLICLPIMKKVSSSSAAATSSSSSSSSIDNNVPSQSVIPDSNVTSTSTTTSGNNNKGPLIIIKKKGAVSFQNGTAVLPPPRPAPPVSTNQMSPDSSGGEHNSNKRESDRNQETSEAKKAKIDTRPDDEPQSNHHEEETSVDMEVEDGGQQELPNISSSSSSTVANDQWDSFISESSPIPDNSDRDPNNGPGGDYKYDATISERLFFPEEELFYFTNSSS